MRKSILIVDDDDDILEVLRYVSESLDIDPMLMNSHVTLDEIESLHPTLILLDHRLPIVSGGDICRQIKSQASIKHIPVILVSAVVNLPQLASMCGADNHISKPFGLEELTSMIKLYVS